MGVFLYLDKITNSEANNKVRFTGHALFAFPVNQIQPVLWVKKFLLKVGFI